MPKQLKQTGSELATGKATPFPKQPSPSADRIRPELNLEKWAIWQSSKSKTQPVERRLKREITLPDGRRITAEVEVGYTNKGALTTEDQKTYYALIKHWEETGRTGDRPVYFSLKILSKMLHKKWGTNVIDTLTQSLVRLRITPFIWTNSYRDGDSKKTEEILEPFQILSDLKIVRTKVDGHVTRQAGYFRFNDHILKNLEANLTKPVLFETVISFQSEMAQILYTYLDLILSDKPIFERRTKELFEELSITGKEYYKPSSRKRILEKALKELQGAPLTTGRIASATIERTKDERDYKIVIRKGRLNLVSKVNHYQEENAAEAMEQIPQRGREAAPDIALSAMQSPAKTQLSRQAEELVSHFYHVFHAGQNFMITSKTSGQAASLISQYGYEQARHVVDYAKTAAQQTNFDIQAFGGIMQYTNRALHDYEQGRIRQEQTDRNRVEEEARARQELIREEQEQEERAEIEAYIDKLSPEDYKALLTRVESEALSHKTWLSKLGEEVRQSFYRRLLVKRVRQDRLSQVPDPRETEA